MKNALISYSKNGPNDEIYTPEYAITPLLKYIPKDKVIWFPFDNDQSNYVKIFNNEGYKTIHSHISKGQDFFNYEPTKHYDIIISNPPFSYKTKILQRCYELNKPFALLLPITSLEGVERNKLYRKYGIQVLVFDKRINFYNSTPHIKQKTKSGSWFNASYFCYMLLPKDLIFEELIIKTI
ncbi:MAG: hypothetical protein KatS3mg002_1590 [Candidatus Woesearchaeota archaeon]|nr:MAG: hypothetical protein KatS3mg002_1590 [Candidatus Woesearchaeota archaeon]